MMKEKTIDKSPTAVLFQILQTKVVVVSLFILHSKLIPSKMEAAPTHYKLPKLSIKVLSFGSNRSVQTITKIDKKTPATISLMHIREPFKNVLADFFL